MLIDDDYYGRGLVVVTWMALGVVHAVVCSPD